MNIKDLLRPSLVAVDLHATSWQDAVRLCGEMFFKEGATEERFTDAMIRVTIEFGPYIVVAPGIALPHALPEDGVLKASIAIAKLKTPVNFGNRENDPVWLLVALAPIDSSQHIQSLAELAQVLRIPENIDRLRHCETHKQLLDVFYSVETPHWDI